MSDGTAQGPDQGHRKTTRVCLLGSEGSGKTSFLAGLAVLAEPNRATPVSVYPNDPVTTDYLDGLSRALRSRHWPPPTDRATPLALRIGLDGQVMDIRVMDYPGGKFRSELRKLARDQVQDLYAYCAASDVLLLFFDPARDVRPANDPSRREEQIERQQAHLKVIAEIWAEHTNQAAGEPARPLDVAIVLARCDKEPELISPAAARRFFRQHAASLDAKIREQADEVAYFPLSVIGPCTGNHDEKSDSSPPEELNPTGYEALIGWLLERAGGRPSRRLAYGAVAVLTAVLLGSLTWTGWQSWDRFGHFDILQDARMAPIERLERTQEASKATVLRQRAELLGEILDGLEGQLKSASALEQLEDVAVAAAQLAQLKPGALQARVERLARDCREKKEVLLYQKLQHARDGRVADFLDACHRFLQAYPASSRAEEVRAMLAKFHDRVKNDDRQAIKQIAVRNAASLAEKGKRIAEFLAKHQSTLGDEEAKRMRRAAELARRFSESNTYQVRLRRTGGLTAAYYQAVVLWIDGKEVHEYRSPGKSQEVNWDVPELRLSWTAGQPIDVTWRKRWSAGSWGNPDIANLHDESSVSLRILGGRQPLTQIESGWEDYCDHPFVHFEVDGMVADDWKSLELYLFPGDAW